MKTIHRVQLGRATGPASAQTAMDKIRKELGL